MSYNKKSMKVALILVLGVLLGAVAYVRWHLWRITPGGTVAKIVVAGFFLIWTAAGIATVLVRDRLSTPVTEVLYEIGQPWMVAFAYLLIAFFLADLAALCKLLPRTFLNSSWTGFLTIVGVIAIVMIAGGIHYRHKYREEITIHTDKPLEKPLTLVMASDLHVGYSNRKAELARWIDLINAEKLDLVLFAGDIVDNQTRPLFEGEYAQEFKRLTAPAYTVMGNHEYIAGSDKSAQFMADAGITLLRDKVAQIDGINIIGRDDRSNPCRAALWEFADSLKGFTVLLDHQPFHLEDAEQMGVDFQFSGHTHRGQFWPYSWVTDLMYEKSWGYLERGKTRYYISSGLGIWGPKIRIGTRSEYLVVHITND